MDGTLGSPASLVNGVTIPQDLIYIDGIEADGARWECSINQTQ